MRAPMRNSTLPASLSFLSAALAAIAFPSLGHAQFVEQWRAGIDNGSNSDFVQENGAINPAPGSATLRDDDWYFAGIYPDPIGTLAADESLQNFERALTIGDPINRIHFNLPESLTLAGTEFRLVIDTVSNNSGVPTNPIPFTVEFNGVEIFSGSVDQTSDFFTTPAFIVGAGAGQVPAFTGDNVVTLSRSTTTGAGWMQFDYVAMSTQAVPEPAATLSLAMGSILLAARRQRRSAR